MSLYTELLAENVPIANYRSDLYCLKTEKSIELIKKYGLRYTCFTSQIDGKLWLDVPFQYDPFWDNK